MKVIEIEDYSFLSYVNVSICLITKIYPLQIFADLINVPLADLEELTEGCFKLL